MENPPDPAQPGSKCHEVDHEKYIVLYSFNQGAEVVDVLRNEKSGEEIVLKDKNAKLHFSARHRAFLTFGQGDPVWASGLLKASIWQTHDGKEFMYQRQSGGGIRRWLSEISNQKSLEVVPLALPGGQTAAQLHVWTFHVSSQDEREGRLFFELIWILKAAGQELDNKAIATKWRKSWQAMCAKRGFENRHVLVPYRSKAAESSFESGMCSDQYSLSTQATLHFLVHLAKTFNQKELLEAFLQTWMPTGVFKLNVPGQVLEVHLLQDMSVNVDQVKAGWLKTQGWKFPPNTSGQIPLSDLLLLLEPCKTSDKIYIEIIKGASARIWEQWQQNQSVKPKNQDQEEESSTAHTRMQAAITRKKTKEDLEAAERLTNKRKAVDEDELPNATSKNKSSGSGKNIDTYNAHERYQYWLASRRALLNCNQVCIVDDDTTIGGKHRMQSALMNLETGETMWGPPLDS